MNDYFEENKRSLILLASMLLVLAIVLYFILIRPLVDDYKREVQRIDDVNAEITLLETELKAMQESTLPEEIDVQQLIFQNKIPTERELDEYILTLQQLEFHTESKIDSITFAYDSSIETDQLEEDEEDESRITDLDDEIEDRMDSTSDEVTEVDATPEVTEEDEEAESAEDEDEKTPTIDPAILSEKPENLHVMTVNLNVTSPNFEEFIELLKLIESNERISIVTSLQFTKPTEEEIYFADIPLEEIPFTAQIATFYYSE